MIRFSEQLVLFCKVAGSKSVSNRSQIPETQVVLNDFPLHEQFLLKDFTPYLVYLPLEERLL
jgi:hypothetical protein